MESIEILNKTENENEEEEEEPLFHLNDDDDEDKQELDDDNQLKCSSCKQLFNQPKFLSCAHTFCFQCCEKFLNNSSNKDQIQCSTCQQITNVSNINELIDNYLLIHEIEEHCLKTGKIECRACTSNEKGVAHCSSCSSYLCEKCCQAHQYMKCFEHHHVRRLSQTDSDEINHSIPIDVEQLRDEFKDKFNQLDEKRSNALANLDHQLTSHQHDFDQTRTNIDSAHQQYQQALNQVYVRMILMIFTS